MTEKSLEITVDKFTFRVRTDRLYAESGAWVALDAATGTARVGLSDYRQQSSGDAAFVELPEAGVHMAAGDELANIETIKVDLAVPAPLSGVVTAVNKAVHDAPELINQDPYGAGWLVELAPDAWPAPGLLDAGAYLALMQAQIAAEAAQ